MGSEQSKTSVGRPSETGVPRNRQFSFPVSEDERSLVADAAKASGKSLTSYLRDAVIAVASGKFHTAISMQSNFQIGNVDDTQPADIGDEPEELAVQPSEHSRAYAPPSARTQNKKEIPKKPELESSSLRSSQALPPVSPEPEQSDEEPWSTPQPLKQGFKLSTGEVVTNTWLFANGSKIPAADVLRLLQSATYKHLKRAMLQCFARSLRDTYRLKWCGAYNRRLNAWRDTPRSNNAFLKAAALLAVEYVDRGMTSAQFIEACDEMRPKSVRFVPVDMLGGAIGARVADWIPSDQRERAKPWDSHMDRSGTQWITPVGEEPIVVLRTAADRERYLKQIKVR